MSAQEQQKETLDRVSAVLCDGRGETPAAWWRHQASLASKRGHESTARGFRAIADLIESERL